MESLVTEMMVEVRSVNGVMTSAAKAGAFLNPASMSSA